jgi:D-methionine transport system ATP-binding protein
VTKRFVQTVGAGDLDKIRSELKKLYPYGQILRLIFTGEISNRPILAEVIRKVDIPVSIVNSNITTGPVGPMGVIYSHISDGTPAQYREFTQLLESEGVKVEVL